MGSSLKSYIIFIDQISHPEILMKLRLNLPEILRFTHSAPLFAHILLSNVLSFILP